MARRTTSTSRRWLAGGVLGAAALMGACSDGPTGPPGGSTQTGDYHIQIHWIGSSATARQQRAVTDAVTRWRSVIVGNLPQVAVDVEAGTCFETMPALDAMVDDLLIYVEFVDIDGPGKILGEAGPCLVRTGTALPAVGYLKLDTSDLERMEDSGTLDDVVLHEIGHVLGIGTLWEHKELLTGAGGDDPIFTGQLALNAYLALGVSSAEGVPVENAGDARDGHWRETVFGNELMTGFISGTPNPLSAMTVASLTDLGYGTKMSAASAYALSSVMAVEHAAREPVELRGRELLRRPQYRIDRDGRIEPFDTASGAAFRGGNEQHFH